MDDKLKEILNTAIKMDYGFHDKDGNHKNAKRNYYLTNYRLMSVDDILKYNIGTCYEYVELISYLLDKEGYKYKKYNIIYDVPNKIARHTFVVVEKDNKYILMETGWVIDNNVFDTLDDLLISVVKRYPKMYKLEDFDINIVEIYEYDKVNVGDDFYQFTDNIRKNGNKISINLEKIYE